MQAPRSRLLASREYIAITSQTSHAFSCAFRLEYWLPKTEVLKTQSIFIFFNFSITDYGLACITGMTVRRFLELLKTHTVLSRGAIVVLVWGALVHQMTDYSAGYVIIGAYATPSLFKYFSVHCTPSCAHMHACRVRSYNPCMQAVCAMPLIFCMVTLIETHSCTRSQQRELCMHHTRTK